MDDLETKDEGVEFAIFTELDVCDAISAVNLDLDLNSDAASFLKVLVEILSDKINAFVDPSDVLELLSRCNFIEDFSTGLGYLKVER